MDLYLTSQRSIIDKLPLVTTLVTGIPFDLVDHDSVDTDVDMDPSFKAT